MRLILFMRIVLKKFFTIFGWLEINKSIGVQTGAGGQLCRSEKASFLTMLVRSWCANCPVRT